MQRKENFDPETSWKTAIKTDRISARRALGKLVLRTEHGVQSSHSAAAALV
jgi:hypothetical protein